MKTPIPRLDETPVERNRRLDAEPDARKPPRVQALSRLQTPQARTRRQVARRLGGSRNPVGRWLAASERGGIAQLRTIAKAPGKTPLVPPAVRPALPERLAHPAGVARANASWPWRQPEDGLSLADKTAPRLVRSQWRAKRKVPRNSPRKQP